MPLPPPVTATVLPSRNPFTQPPPRFASNIQLAVSRPGIGSQQSELVGQPASAHLAGTRPWELGQRIHVLRNLVRRQARAGVCDQFVGVDITDDRDAHALAPPLV